LVVTALADAAGIDRTYVSRLERGAHNLTVATLAQLAEALNVAPGQLLDSAIPDDDRVPGPPTRKKTDTPRAALPRPEGDQATADRLPAGSAPPGSTVLAVVTTLASLTKPEAQFLAARGSDGITTAVRPAHTRRDGDLVLALGMFGGPVPTDDLDRLGMAAVAAVATAVRGAVTRAGSAG
jgi:L-aminopeptidase/D-esterase-like protein